MFLYNVQSNSWTSDFLLIELRYTFRSHLLTTFTNHCYLVNGIFNWRVVGTTLITSHCELTEASNTLWLKWQQFLYIRVCLWTKGVWGGRHSKEHGVRKFSFPLKKQIMKWQCKNSHHPFSLFPPSFSIFLFFTSSLLWGQWHYILI